MKNILLIAPTGRNGGISSWANKLLSSFSTEDFHFISIDSALKHRLETEMSPFKRIYAGLLDLMDIRKSVKTAIRNNKIDIMHITTSGSFATLRDYVLGRMCRKNGMKMIMHCHYGNMSEFLNSKGIFKHILLYTMRMYDEIWILDSKTEYLLKKCNKLSHKAYLVPNGIDVPDLVDITPKTFNKIAFIGNVIPSKGIFELIKAVLKIKRDVILYIVGPADEELKDRIKAICKDQLGNKIQVLGKMDNRDAVAFMKNIDILALPTYYRFEAFPISILEAMSYGKLVISTNRAAIPNMLTAHDGSMCGILVEEQNTDAIQKAIEFCIDHPEEGNRMCEKAYQKVREAYRLDVVYKMIEDRYKNL